MNYMVDGYWMMVCLSLPSKSEDFGGQRAQGPGSIFVTWIDICLEVKIQSLRI
jgi:hypothetical protein